MVADDIFDVMAVHQGQSGLYDEERQLDSSGFSGFHHLPVKSANFSKLGFNKVLLYYLSSETHLQHFSQKW